MKRFSILVLGALAIMMASCSKNIEPTSPDPDAWMHDASLPVPVMFSTNSQPMTKAAAINGASDMVGKEFGFFAFHDNMDSYGSAGANGNTITDNGIVGWSQNVKGTIESDPGTGIAQFTFDGGPYYYPQSSVNNYRFYGYHAHVTEVRPQTASISVVVDLGKTDVLWARAWAEDIIVTENTETNTYKGYNARYIRKSLVNGPAKHPRLEFKHLTSCVSFTAKTVKSAYASEHSGEDVVTINKISILNTSLKANLCVAHMTDENAEGVLSIRTSNIGTIDSGNITVELEETPKTLIATNEENNNFFIMPSDEITVKIDFTVKSGTGKEIQSSSTYTLKPEFKEKNKNGQETGNTLTGFHAGYKYAYNFVVYTPERVVIEATVERYKDAFDGPMDILPEDE